MLKQKVLIWNITEKNTVHENYNKDRKKTHARVKTNKGEQLTKEMVHGLFKEWERK